MDNEERFGPLQETKRQLLDRLRAAGRWSEFAARKEQLLAEGMSASEAWETLAPQFQLEETDAAGDYEDDLPAFEGEYDPSATLDVTRDVAWCYHNFGKQVSQPPSPGAIEMLRWARRNRTKFFSDVVAKVRPADDEVEARKLQDDGRQVFDVIARFQHANPVSPTVESQ